MKKNRKNPYLFGVLTAAVILYLALSVYFMEHFFPGTRINGADYGLFSVAEAENALLAQVGNTSLSLLGKEGVQEVVTLEALGGHYEAHNEVLALKRKQNGFLWLRMLWSRDSFSFLPDVFFEEETFENTLDSLDCIKGGTSPQNARILFTDTGYRVEAERDGTLVDRARFSEGVRQAFASQTPDIRLQDYYQKPDICKDSPALLEITAQLDIWLSARITYEIGEAPLILDAGKIREWIDISQGKPLLLTDKIEAYVDELADTCDGESVKRVFYSTRRGRIVLSDSRHAWRIDREAEKEALLACIREGKVMEREPYYLVPSGPKMGSEIGNTYVEVDITAQHLWVYRDGQVVMETDVVTGNMSKGQGTPGMLAYIYSKERNRTLRGPGYTDFVQYWVPFYRGYGIHDSSWRTTFGGDIYKTNGSHGCVNISRDIMGDIFEQVEVGMPVVLYY